MGDRRMVYPYTLTAKVANFPFKYYFENMPIFKGYCIGILLCIPIFWKIQKIVCSEGNYVKYEKYRKATFKEWEHHKEHLL